MLRRPVDQHEVDVVQPELREILSRRRIGVFIGFDLGDDVDRVTLEAAGLDRITDAALRVVVRSRVDHAKSLLQGAADRLDRVRVELPRAEAEQRHPVAGGQDVTGLGREQGFIVGVRTARARVPLQHCVHVYEATRGDGAWP